MSENHEHTTTGRWPEHHDLWTAAADAQRRANEVGEPYFVRKVRCTGRLVIQPASRSVDGNRYLTIWGPAEPE